MENNQVRIVRQLIDDVWNRGDLAALDTLLTHDFTNHDPMGDTRGIPS